MEGSLAIPDQEKGQLMTLPFTIRFLFLNAFYALGAFAPSSPELLSPRGLTMGGDFALLRVLCLGTVLTCWIPGYMACKLSRVFQRDHLAGCALLSAFLGWEMQCRLTAYLFPFFC
ncbi:hypothetical protein AAFN60_05030 [Roseibacillus persicicus]|uniref:hypothetical protein n=1 Tax=Roseibacillus persicicus TaxID=454148 RepID=UPI00398B2372